METRIYNDLALHGALVMSVNQTGFPENPVIGTMIIKDQCLYAYIKIGGMETWYPFANKTNSYVHTQGLDSLIWTVQHNLGTRDVWIQVKDQNGNIVQVGKTDIDDNSFELHFTQATRGTAVVVAPDSINVPDVKATLINVGEGSVIIDTSGVRVNGEYVLTDANINQQISDAVAVETARATGVEGALASLTTTAKTNLVAAINEVDADIAALDSAKADKSTTLAGYGITDAVSSTANVLPLTSVKQVSGNVFLGSSNSATVVDSFAISEAYTAKYLVEVAKYTNSYSGIMSDVQSLEIMLTHNGVSMVYLTEYGITPGTSLLASFDAAIVSGNVELTMTPASKYVGIKFLRSTIQR